jgi:hypothetical protein
MEVLEFLLWRTALRLHCEESMKGHQSDQLCSCFSSLKEAIDVVAEDRGTLYPKKHFQNIIPYLVMAKSDISL